MSRFLEITVSILIVSLLGGFLAVAHAQEDTGDISDNDVSVTTIPEVPGAYQNISMSLESYAINLDQFMVVWSLNGKTLLSGFGQKQFSFQTGAIGEETRVMVQIKQGTRVIIAKRISITPSEVDLLWEVANGYTPPFYKGKTLPTTESIIRVVAIPHTKENGGTIFSWRRNYNAIPQASGYNKNTFLFKNSPLNKNETISVITTENDTSTIAKNSTTVSITQPFIHFYETTPLLGTRYETTLDRGIVVGPNDIGIVAEPFFVTPTNIESSDLGYSWTINGSTITPPQHKNILTLRHGGNSGSTKIKLTIESISKLLLSVEKDLSVTIK